MVKKINADEQSCLNILDYILRNKPLRFKYLVQYKSNSSRKMHCPAQDLQIFQCLNAEAFDEFASGDDEQLFQGP